MTVVRISNQKNCSLKPLWSYVPYCTVWSPGMITHVMRKSSAFSLPLAFYTKRPCFFQTCRVSMRITPFVHRTGTRSKRPWQYSFYHPTVTADGFIAGWTWYSPIQKYIGQLLLGGKFCLHLHVWPVCFGNSLLSSFCSLLTYWLERTGSTMFERDLRVRAKERWNTKRSLKKFVTEIFSPFFFIA
jgi:hypothetical protein